MFTVTPVDFTDAQQCTVWFDLLDMYARDPMGGAVALQPEIKHRLCQDLAAFAGAVSLIAWHQGAPVGLLNAFKGYSTFKAKPLMNIHDVAVVPAWRGKGVGRALFKALEELAREQGCCKLTLEVLSGNQRAKDAYVTFGFEDYALDPNAGVACFMQKWL
jgi:GNAT superfamily N-acetyltransferase